VRAAEFDEVATHAAMQAREYTIALDLGCNDGRPGGQAHFITCDLTHEYVSINADYSS
jgi:glutamate N-acetyltransferase/amino-acid N-acetyltransferase